MVPSVNVTTVRDTLISVLSVVVSCYLVPWLKAHAAAAQQNAIKAKLDAKAKTVDHLEDFIYSATAAVAEKGFPILAKRIKTGEITTPDQVRQMLSAWADLVRGQAVKSFDQQDINVVKEVGVTTIDKMIADAANHMGPFQGQQTSQKMLQPGVADTIISKGIQFVKENADTVAGCRACIPTCDTCPLKKA